MIRIVLFYLIQLLLIIHCIRNHKGFGWIWLLVFLPFVGGLAYLIVEIVPDFFHRSRGSADQISAKIFPGKRLENARNELKRSPTPYNKLVLAETCFELDERQTAEKLYRELTEGWYKNDSAVLLKFARCLIAWGEFGEACAVLKQVHSLDPLTRTSDKALLYYSDFMSCGDNSSLKLLEELYENTHDLESGYYLCLCYRQAEDPDRIRLTISAMKEQVRNNRFLRKSMETEWISRSEKLLP